MATSIQVHPHRNHATTAHRAGAWLAAVLLIAVEHGAWGADIQLKPKAEVQGTLVRLGDVANILDADSDRSARLAKVELCPAPLPGQQLNLSASDIQRTLLHRGVELSSVRFSGAGRVAVSAVGAVQAVDAATPRSTPINTASVRQANSRAVEAITAYLERAVGSEQPWDITLHWDHASQRRIAQAAHLQVVGALGANQVAAHTAAHSLEAQTVAHRGETAGPVEPATFAAPTDVNRWLGPQTFVLSLHRDGRREPLMVSATVSLTPAVVVATVAISKGTVLQAEHLKLQRGTKAAATDACHRLEDVVGKQATINMAAGQIIDAGMVQEPELVRRGEIVTVNVYSAGVRLRMEAKARESGRRGDTILVEALNDRRLFQGRVCALQTVEVLARGTSLGGDERMQ